MSKGLQIAIATLSVFVALGWMMSSNEGAFQYFESVSQLSPDDHSLNEGLRVRGFVVEGSIARDVQSGYVEFAIHDRNPEQAAAETQANVAAVGSSNLSQTLAVHYDGIDLPDMFRDGAEVIVEGGFVKGRFVASKILAKCPSKYQVAPAVPEQKA